jgi:hypothetical protein
MMLAAVRAQEGLWVDVDFPLTPAKLALLRAWSYADQKVVGVLRYGPLPNNSVIGDLSAQEAEDICGAGFQLIGIQHPLAAGWIPTENLGAIHEEHASTHFALCGLPASLHQVCDVEGTGGPSYGYALTWSANRKQRGGSTMLYYGWLLGMSLAQAEGLPDVDAYYEAYNQPRVGGRGPCLVQGVTVTVPGVGNVDVDTMAADLRGDLPLVCAAA